jgi:uncharacterized protein (TIGR02996 family)
MADLRATVSLVAERPDDDSARLALGDLLEGRGQPARGEYVRAICAAEREQDERRRFELLDRADDLRAEHEDRWLGEWRERLVDWEFRCGFLHRVRMTASEFLRHGEGLFGAEPVARLELVNEAHLALSAEGVRAVVSHPAFAHVRDCAIVPAQFFDPTPLGAWLEALAGNARITRLAGLGLTKRAPLNRFEGLEPPALAAFCKAAHLRTLARLELPGRPGGEAHRDWLVPQLAAASFATSLRSLRLRGAGIGRAGFERVASDRAFAGLRELDLSGNGGDPEWWSAVLQSPSLASLEALVIPADQLAAYSQSALAPKVTDLTVVHPERRAVALDEGREAWSRLLSRGARPERLSLRIYNPGAAVFEQMTRLRWTDELRELSIAGDSQADVFGEEPDAVVSLFQPDALPRLTALRLHEASFESALVALRGWRRLEVLERLELTDDYYGRLLPSMLAGQSAPRRLGTLRGVALYQDADVERFLALPCLARLKRLELSCCKAPPALSPSAAARILRDPRLSRLEELSLWFPETPAAAREAGELLASREVLPRLRRLRFDDDGAAPRDGLQARFGPRLEG